MPPTITGWGRGPLAMAGVAMLCLLGAFGGLVVGAASDELLSGAILAALLVVAALMCLALQAVLLVRDRFPRDVLQRLERLEARFGTDPPPAAVTVAQPEPGDAASSPRPTSASQPPPEPPPDAAPVPAPGPTRAPRGPVRWELVLGGRGLAVVGGVVTLVAVGLFLKFGWDQGWFRPSPAARVALGLGAGFVLLALGEAARRREQLAVVSQVLTAVGIGAVYVSVWAAHGLYGLVSAGPALLLLAAAAAAGVAIATVTGGRAVASLSAIGGLLAPVVVDLPAQAPIALYAYLLVVLAAAAAVAAGRRWPELGPIAAAGVAVHVAGAFEWRWATDTGRLADAGFLLAAIVLLVAISLAFAWRRRTAPGPVELGVLAAASLGGWAAGLARLDPLGPVVGGVWTLVVLAVELGAAQVLLVRLGRHARGRGLFLALAGVLLVALPPVVWDGAWVAAAWALEALVATVVGGAIPAAGRSAAVVSLLVAGAAGEASGQGRPPAVEPFANLDWLLLGAATAMLTALLAVVERRRRDHGGAGPALEWTAAPAALLTGFAWLGPEISRWSRTIADAATADAVAVLTVGTVLAVAAAGLLAAWRHRTATATWLTGLASAAAALVWIGSPADLGRWAATAAAVPIATVAAGAAATALRRRDPRAEWSAAGLGIAVAAIAALVRLRIDWPGADVAAAGLAPAALAAAAAALMLAAARGSTARPAGRWLELAGWTTAVAAASRVLAAAVAHVPPTPDADSQRAGLVALSVLWGGAGLALVLAGLAGGAPHRRHLGLALLVTTVVKVFLFDLAAAPTVLRIVAFLVTGLALLAGAWLYARYRDRLEPAS